MRCIGIDLGTTHSLIAVYEDGQARLIENSLGNVLTPSVVSIAKDGSLLVGEPARERLISHPNSSAHAFKRMIGTKKTFCLGEHRFRAEELSSLILKSLKEDAEKAINETIENVVISVPAYFNSIQRNATIVAAELAGLKVSRLINEPTAAALYYGLQNKQDEKHFLILDLGGGTFDVTILELFEGVFEVHASAGDNFLGGEDFTKLIVTWLQIIPEAKGLKLTHAQFYQIAEQLKHKLSDAEVAAIALPNGKVATLTREIFESLASDLINRIREPIVKAVRDAELEPSDFDEIIFVGGATRMPIIKKFITRLFGRFPEMKNDPDTVVALGTAIQAGLLQRGVGLDEIVLTDVMPYSLGIATNNENDPERAYFTPIIERNQTIPISRNQKFSTVKQGQRKVDIAVYQGESHYVENNLLLDKFEVKLPRSRDKQSFDVRFTYDNSGILEVNLESEIDNIVFDRVIQQQQSNMTEQEVQGALARMAKLKIDARELSQNRLVSERAERLYEQSINEQRLRVSELIGYFDNALSTQDERVISAARHEVMTQLDILEEGCWF